jgi:3-hydroxymyristoyl/3-hydroxydecanoyl-(acyl carrier protein) dehydratase
MEFTEDCIIDAAHPALPGHFPGYPVVPGVVLLEQVLRTAARAGVGAAVNMLPQVKFIEPLLPAQPFTILLRSDRADRWRFECVRDGRVIASGLLQTEAA